MKETIFNLVEVKNLTASRAHRDEIQRWSHSESLVLLLLNSFFSAKGKSRGISNEENGENCTRRNTIFNISQELGKKDGWRMLVTQLQERLGRRDCDDSMKGLVPLREFQKFDSAFPAYLKGRRNKSLLCVWSSLIFTFQEKLQVVIIIKQVLLGGYTFVMFYRLSHFDQEDSQSLGNDIFSKADQ